MIKYNYWNTLNDNCDLYLNVIKTRKKNKKQYFENHNTFDIEVTNYLDENNRVGIPYLWMYAFSEKVVYYGRTLEEFKQFLDCYYDLIKEKNAIQVIYVHNLAYEFQFIRKLFDWDEVFLIDVRKPLYIKYKCFEFRCSYLLSNMSLDNFLKNNGCKVQKLAYDYNKQRFSWTNLSLEELQYCANDTIGLYECIKIVLKNDKKDVTNIPLTSTAYVRQDIKKVQTLPVKQMIKRLSNITPDLYLALKGAFVGGNTHANRMWINKIIDNVNCYDITSSYPYCQMCCEYPIEPFREKKIGLDDLRLDKKFAYLLLCEFRNIEIKDYFDGMPNISRNKCINLENEEIDNGRILCADYILIWLTDIEYNITSYHYKFDVSFKKVYYSRYGLLPDCIKACIYQYFFNKCTLKETNQYLYMKSKNKLNSIYGMSAFDVGKQRFKYENNDYQKDNREISKILSELFENTTMAEPYSWGVWTTARARENLDNAIRLASDRYVYCDTDSIYVIGELDLKTINNNILKKSKEYGVNYNGNDYYLGIWKHDKECEQFITLGAKKYCYKDKSGVHTVTAGVSKKAGVKDIEDYQIGYVFKNATNEAWYLDDEISLSIFNHNITIPSSIYIESADYTLGITETYRALLLSMGNSNLSIYSV